MSREVSTIRAVVREIDGAEAIVEVEQGGCGRCHEKGGCGGQSLSQMLCASHKTYRVDNPGGAAVGEAVTVAIAAGAIRWSANLAYGVPILGLIVGAVAGNQIAADPGAVLGGALGLGIAWVVGRAKVAGTGKNAMRPHIVSRS